MGSSLLHMLPEGEQNDHFVAPAVVRDEQGEEHRVRLDFSTPLESRVNAFAEGGVDLQRASYKLTRLMRALKEEHSEVYYGLDGLVGILESVQDMVHALSEVRSRVRESVLTTTDKVVVHGDRALQEHTPLEEPIYHAPTHYVDEEGNEHAVALAISSQLDKRVADYIHAVMTQCANGVAVEDIVYALHKSHPTQYAIVIEQHGLKELLLAVLHMDEMEGVRQW